MSTPGEVAGISAVGRGYGLVFEADFRNRSGPEDAGSLEILLFSDDSGHLSYVEIDYCGNGLLMPEHLSLELTPYNVFRSDALIQV